MNTPTIKNFVPLCDLTAEHLKNLAAKTPVQKLAKGQTLFSKGDRDNDSIYLLSGEVLLQGDKNWKRLIAGGTDVARYALDNNQPHQVTATAATDIAFFRVDNDLLDILLTWDQNAGMMVSEIDQEEQQEESHGDWMSLMLRSEIFHRIPPGNIQQAFMKMEAVTRKPGEVVIKQGDEGDYYYFITQGRAVVTHTTRAGKVIKLAELEAGQYFGEEALIADNRRNASVTMQTKGELMRLAKEDFNALLKTPILNTVNYEEALNMVATGKAQWLDVRLESEYRNIHIPGSRNIPLFLLRIKADSLDRNKKLIVCCDTARRSASAAYLLSERGHDACYLQGGLRSLQKEQLAALNRGAV